MAIMPADTPIRSTRRAVDEPALARIAARLYRAGGAPWLHKEVARRMAERLPVVRLRPQWVVDWGAQLGGGRSALVAAYPKARIVAEEVHATATAGPLDAGPWWSRLLPRAHDRPAAEGRHGAGSDRPQAQLLWSNMALHGSVDPQAVMRRWQELLQVGGFLMFSTLGPGTLQGLRDLYRTQQWPVPHAPFVDMHDLGDMLVEAGFADPVMDQETITLTWADAEMALAELRGLGGNADPRRFAGLRTPRWRQRLVHALQARAGHDSRVALQFEVVYGHAFRAPPRHLLQAQTTLPLEDMRAMVRAGRGKP